MRVDHCHEDRRQGSVFLLGVYIKGSLRAMDEDAKKYLPGKFCLHLCGFDNEGGCKFVHDDYPTMHCKTLRRVIHAARVPERRGRQLVAVPSRQALGDIVSPSGSRPPPAKRRALGVGGGVPVFSDDDEDLAGAETAGAVAALKRRSSSIAACSLPRRVTLPARGGEGGDSRGDLGEELPPGPPPSSLEGADAVRTTGRPPEREDKVAELR
jgi:hypothetical protein